jgi:hypothetical protein
MVKGGCERQMHSIGDLLKLRGRQYNEAFISGRLGRRQGKARPDRSRHEALQFDVVDNLFSKR